MPKDEPALTVDEIATLRDWIDQGAEYPASVVAKSTPSILKTPPRSIWEKYSNQIDYAQKIHDAIGVLYLPLLIFLIVVLVAERTRRSVSNSVDANPTWVASALSRFGRTEYVVVVLGFALAAVVRLDRARIAEQRAELKSLQDQFDSLTGSNTEGEEKTTGIPIYRPKHPPRLGGEYFRGNDERNPELFNGGYYRTAQMEVALENAERTVLKWNDKVTAGDFYIRLTIEKAPFATPSLFVEDNMLGSYLTRYSEDSAATDGTAMLQDKAFLKSVVKDERWEARYRIGSFRETESSHWNDRLYLSPAGGGPHYGIVYDINIVEGRIAESSQLWMGSTYLTGGVVVPKPDAIPLSEWFDFLPIPEITGENSKDPKLLGIEPK